MNVTEFGVCPLKDFLQYRIDLERNGYKILSTETKVIEGQDLVLYSFIKVDNIAKTVMFSQ